MEITWQRCEPPRPACAVSAIGALAVELAGLAHARAKDGSAELEIVQTQNEAVVIGAAEHLPWLDGVQYLGVLGEAQLLCSVHLEPDVHARLLASAVARKARPGRGPFAILHIGSEIRIVPLPGVRLPEATA